MTNPVLNQDRVAFIQARTEVRKVLVPAWPRAQKELKLVELEVGWVKFSTLNHRTRAEQLKAEHDSNNPTLFTGDPLGPTAQKAQYDILRSQDGFAALKQDLLERGQNDPAIITAEGILINGNRRTAALRSLFEDDSALKAQYVQCLVLPEDATLNELTDLEAELQVARDFKEGYSWVNEAFLIEELFNREGRNWTHVAKKMHRDESAVRNLYDKLQQLHQLVSLSNDTRLHIDFSANESAFDELAKHLRTNRSKAEQDSVRSTYFLGTLVGVNYRELRHLRRPDAAELVLKELAADPNVGPLLQMVGSMGAAQDDEDPLGELLGEPASPASDVMAVLAFLASKNTDELVLLPTGHSVPVQNVFESVQSAIRAAAADAEEDAREQSTVATPGQRVDEAGTKLKKALQALPRARALDDWNEMAFQGKVTDLKDLLAALAAAAS
jgi:hypothetical protein